MRRRFLVWLVLSCLVFVNQGAAAFNATMQWDVRTSGNDGNAGGFDPGVVAPGTDFSQQNSPQISFTDIIIGATTTQGTSILHPFDTTSPGNVINITAGATCTVQRVEVLSVSGTTATFDKSLGTAAATCTGALGGSLLTWAKAVGGGLNVNVSNIGSTVNIKAGTYTITTGVLADAVGFNIIGYGVTHNDGGTRPLLTTATNSVKLLQVNAQLNVKNISFSNTAAVRADGIWNNAASDQFTCYSCILDGFVVGINFGTGASSPGFVFLAATEIKNCSSDGVQLWNHSSLGAGTYIHNNTGAGVALEVGAAQSLTVSDAIIASNGGGGIVGNTNNIIFLSNVAIVNNTGAGITPNGAVLSTINCIIYGNSTWGIDSFTNAGTGTALSLNTAFGSNTSGNRRNVVNLNGPLVGDITLTAGPFVNSGTGNYALNSTAGGGALLKQAGFPGIFPGGTSTGYLDVGAVQTSGAPGTGGVSGGAFVQ